jgi:hypothetical protein
MQSIFESSINPQKIKRMITKNRIKQVFCIALFGFAILMLGCDDDTDVSEDTTDESTELDVSFTLTDTEQSVCYDNNGDEITAPSEGEDYYGQDAQFTGTDLSYTDNDDGTVTDNNTGLMWQQTPNYDRMDYYDALDYVDELDTGDYDDWRLPTIKELYSLLYSDGSLGTTSSNSIPYLDTDYFDFEYDENMMYAAQYWSSNIYLIEGIQDDGKEGAFGMNFADGHIKGYGTGMYFESTTSVDVPGCFVRAVRGEEDVYGVNDFTDNGDSTVTDNSTGLMWQQADDGNTYNWKDALAYAYSSELAGYTDWRLPNTKEIESIVDYDATSFPAIDNVFSCTEITDETDNGTNGYGWYWSGTTHGDFKYAANYVCFGAAWSKEDSDATVYYDWHGAGAQRADPKSGDPSDYDMSSINATDLVRITNFVRLVRDVD